MAVSQELLDAHLRKRGLDPAAWEYDEATDEFVQREVAPVKPSFMERMHKPMVDMEDLGSVVSRVAPSWGAEIKNRLEPVPGDDVLNSTLKGIYNSVGGVASGLTSKANLALLGASVVPGLQLPAAAAFVGMGAKGGAEAVKKIATRAGEWSGGGAPIGVQEGIELGSEGTLNLAGVLAGRHLATKAADKSVADFSAMEQARKVQAEAEAIAQAKEAGEQTTRATDVEARAAEYDARQLEKERVIADRAAERQRAEEAQRELQLEQRAAERAAAEEAAARKESPVVVRKPLEEMQGPMPSDADWLANQLRNAEAQRGVPPTINAPPVEVPAEVPGTPARSAAEIAAQRAEMMQKFPRYTAEELNARLGQGEPAPTILRRPLAEWSDPAPEIITGETVKPGTIVPVEEFSNPRIRTQAGEQLTPSPDLAKLQAKLAEQQARLKTAQTEGKSGVARNNIVNGIRRTEAAIAKAQGGGLRVGEALKKNERGEGGAVSGPDPRARDPFLDSRKMLGSLREAVMPNLGRVRIPVLQSTLQKIHGMNTKSMKIAGDTISEVFGKRVKYVGQYENRITDALRPLSAEQANGLREALESMTDTGTHTAKSMLDPAQQAAYEQIRTVLADQADAQIAAGQLVQDGKVWRERGKDPFYFPQIASRHVLRIIKNEIHSPEGQKLAKDYIDHRMNKLGETVEQAQAHLDKIAGAIDEGGMISPADASHYGAVRKAEGAGLPKSWREQNLDAALRKYTRKFGSDRAFHDVIEKNPDAMHVLGMTHDLQGNPIVPKSAGLVRAENMDLVRNAMREFMGHMDDPSSHLMAAAQRLFSAGAINVMGKVHDIGSVTTHLAAHLPDPVLDLPGMHAAIADTAKLAKAQANAIANGLIVKDIGARQIAMNALKGIEQRTVTFAETMSEAGRMLNEINQNNRLEMYARTVAQAGAEYVVGRTMELAKAGESASIRSLERWAPDWRNMTEDQIATRVAELVQGTYDVRGQPYIPPEWRPYTGLARWGIEQANNAAEFMVEPLLKEGKTKPLFAAVGTAYLMGTALNELRKGLTGRQGNMPTQEEVDEATPEMKNRMQAYRALALIESMGVGGMVTSLTKGLVDEVMMKMDARGIKYPTYEAAADMVKKTTAMSSALMEGEDPMEVLQQYSTDMLMSSVGTLRYAVQIASHLTGEDMPGAHVADVQRMEDYRNKRMHDITQGESFRPLQRPKPDYSALSVREFKRTGDPERAKELLPKVIDRAVRRSHGDAQLLDEELSSLRRNNIQSFPNMDVNPEQAAQYYHWLVKTKGKAVADAALARYRLQNALNNAKRDAIPQLR